MPAGGKRLSEPKILVLDDEENILKVVTRILEASGYRPLGVKDLDAAKRTLTQQGPVAAALLDFSLHGTSCSEAFQGLRSAQSDLKVVLMSGFGLSELKLDFPEADQCAAFLKKPFGLDTLLQVVESVCPKA